MNYSESMCVSQGVLPVLQGVSLIPILISFRTANIHRTHPRGEEWLSIAVLQGGNE